MNQSEYLACSIYSSSTKKVAMACSKDFVANPRVNGTHVSFLELLKTKIRQLIYIQM
jgi:hypothetical protein